MIDVRFAPFAQLALALCGAAVARPRRGAARARGRRGARARAAGRGARRRVVARAAVLDRLELLGARGQGAVARLERALRADPRRRRRPAGQRRVRPAPRARRLAADVRDAVLLLGPRDARGRLQPGEHDDAPGLLPGLGAVRALAEPVPQPPLLALRSGERAARGCACSTSGRSSRRARRSTAALDARADVVREAEIPPYTVFRLRDPGPGYVEPLAFEPVRAPPRDWRDQSYRWYTRKPPNRALLVFSDDPRFTLAQPDPWAPPPERPLAGRRARARDGRGRVGPDRDGPPGPPAAGQDLLPPALARRGRGRPVPRLAGADADRAEPPRGAAALRGPDARRLARPRPGARGCRR